MDVADLLGNGAETYVGRFWMENIIMGFWAWRRHGGLIAISQHASLGASSTPSLYSTIGESYSTFFAPMHVDIILTHCIPSLSIPSPIARQLGPHMCRFQFLWQLIRRYLPSLRIS